MYLTEGGCCIGGYHSANGAQTYAMFAVPVTLAEVVGVAAGAQRPERATWILAAIQSLPHIWPLTFAFGRALTAPALAAWGGQASQWAAGQRALADRVAMNMAAMEGRYAPTLTWTWLNRAGPACRVRR